MLTFFTSELEELGEAMALGMMTNVVTWIFAIVSWVLGSIALYSMAKRRGIRNAWLSWIPVGNGWILGSLSDQYQYVAKGAVKNKRKALLILDIVLAVLSTLVFCLSIYVIVMATVSISGYDAGEQFVGAMMGMLFSLLPLLGVTIATAVVRYMALYDVYRSCAPENAVMFLVLSIFFSVTEPFFLFFNRQKDAGMVKQEQPVYRAPSYLNQPSNDDPWNQNGPQNDQQ